MQKFVLTKLKNLWSDSLYRNSFWLMAGTFSMTGIGFIYWLGAARLYTPTVIGLATTFLSATNLINNFAILGFGTTLIRYLPGAKSKDDHVNTAFTSVSLMALVCGAIYLLGLPIWTEKVLFIRSSLLSLTLIMFFFPVNTLNGITDSVFTAYRETQWVFASNVIQSLSKLVFVFLFSGLGVWGVLGSNMLGIFIAVVFSLAIMKIVYKINFKFIVRKAVLLEVKTYALGNYMSGLIGAIPTLVMPIIITNRISPAQTAFFYMPNMISSLLTIVPATISRSYFTESSNSNILVSMKKPILITYAVLVPLSLVFFFFGRPFLALFGHDYAAEGYTYLILITVSVLSSVFNYFLGTKLLIEHKLNKLLVVNLISAFCYLGLSWVFTSKGINGVGISAIISQFISLFVLTLVSR